MPRVVTFAPITRPAAAHVVAHLREADQREFSALMFAWHPPTITEMAMQATLGAVVSADGWPIAVIGARRLWPGVFQVGMFATDGWSGVAAAATRWGLKEFKPALLRAGGHRAQAASIIDHPDSHRWLQFFGFRAEAELRDYGRNRETFIQFAWRL